jgi:hypothetical protein
MPVPTWQTMGYLWSLSNKIAERFSFSFGAACCWILDKTDGLDRDLGVVTSVKSVWHATTSLGECRKFGPLSATKCEAVSQHQM